MALSAVGLAELWFLANPLSAIVAFLTVLSYVVVYTPMKLKSSLSTLTPIQRCGSQRSRASSSNRRSARFVRIW